MKQRICISSPPDRERLVAEIFFDDIQWAELNQENKELKLELYNRPDGKGWEIPYDVLISALGEAKSRLLG